MILEGLVGHKYTLTMLVLSLLPAHSQGHVNFPMSYIHYNEVRPP